MQLQIRKRIRAFKNDPMKKLAAIVRDLRVLRANLHSMERPIDPVPDIVCFFNFVSPWYDRGFRDIIAAFEDVNWGQYDGVLECLRVLELHFVNAGRNKCGMNRTECGEAVTEDNVYLGDVWGLWTKTARFWRGQKDKPKGGWGYSGMEHLNAYDVVSDQAREFMIGHIGPMTRLIDELDEFVRQAEAA